MSEERDRAIRTVIQVLHAREMQLASLAATRMKGIPNSPSGLPPAGAPLALTTVQGSAAPLVNSRAPTLIGGLTPGARGEVRVWAPQRGLVLKSLGKAARNVVAAGVLIAVAITHHLGSVVYWLLPKASIGLVAAALASLRRPCVVTTDEGGIAVTTWRGSRALRWEEIVAAVETDFHLYVYTAAGERIAISRVGHRDDTREALTSMVLRSARLEKTTERWWCPGRQRYFFLRSDMLLTPGRDQSRWRPAFMPAPVYRRLGG